MSQFQVDPRRRVEIMAAILRSIDTIVDENVDDPADRALLKLAHRAGHRIGKYIVDQIPYTSLDNIRFPKLPTDDDGDLDQLGETDEVQRYGILEQYWTGDPYVSETDDVGRAKKYGSIPIGFPVTFGQKRYPEEGFSQWRQHNGVKALRIEYRVFEGRPFGRPAHLTVFYSGGDH